MAKKRTGTVTRLKDGRFQPQVTFCCGTRKRLAPFPEGTTEDEARAETAKMAAQIEEHQLVYSKPAEDAVVNSSDNVNGTWVRIWIGDKRARGQTAFADSFSRYEHHIKPVLGTKPLSQWGAEDLRALVFELDRKVQAGALRWKTAKNIWGTATAMCAEAAESKNPSLRVRADNPAAGVRGPDEGAQTQKQFLYPSEFMRFALASTTSHTWRQVSVVSTYLYLRHQELKALRCEDIDLDHRIVHVHRAFERRSRTIKTTKGAHNRRVPIEAALMPVLELIIRERGGSGLLIPTMPSDRDMSRGLRRWLMRAGVDRADLHERSLTHKAMTFHDLRSTGITWMAVRGDEPLKIQQRAGHKHFDTTQRYIREADSIREGFGIPFPSLSEVVEILGANRTAQSHDSPSVSGKFRESLQVLCAADGTRKRGSDSVLRQPRQNSWTRHRSASRSGKILPQKSAVCDWGVRIGGRPRVWQWPPKPPELKATIPRGARFRVDAIGGAL
jgi:integrase